MAVENQVTEGAGQIRFRNGFYEIPFLTDSPKVMMETYKKLHNLEDNSARYDIAGDFPFLSNTTRFREIEEGLYLIQSEIHFKANVCFASQEDSPKNLDYYCLSLQINDYTKNINSLAETTSYTDNCWLIFKPSGHVDHFHFSGTNGLYFLLFFTEQWLKNYMKQMSDDKSRLLHLFLNSSQDFLICPNFQDEPAFNKSSLQKAIVKESVNEKEYLMNLKKESLEFISFFLFKMESEEINENHFKISNQDRIKVLKAKKFLDTFLYKKFPGIKLLAEYAGISETRLKECFKIIFGQTILNYFQSLQMEKARELLTTGNFKVVDVSAKMGYRSSSKFASAFKQVTGVLPSKVIPSN